MGIVLRQFDNTESHEEPWRGCPRGGPTDSNNDCNIFGNRLSASVIFPEQRRGSIDASIPLFAVSSGVIFNPTAIGITCAYSNDGGSRGRSDGCGTDWCPATRGATDGWCDGRPHAPANLKNALKGSLSRGGYNEVIIDSQHLQSKLPQAIAAFFFVRGQPKDTIVKAHRAFIAKYSTKGVTEATVPLVELDDKNWDAPFSAAASTL